MCSKRESCAWLPDFFSATLSARILFIFAAMQRCCLFSKTRICDLFPLSLTLIIACAIAGCQTKEKPPQEPHRDSTVVYDLAFPKPQFPPSRSLDTIMAVDLDGKGRVD